MALRIRALPPEKAKKQTRANFELWKGQKELEGKRAKARRTGPEAQDPKPRTKGKPPLAESIVGIDWSKLDLDQVETMIAKANGVPAWELLLGIDFLPQHVHHIEDFTLNRVKVSVNIVGTSGKRNELLSLPSHVFGL